MTSHHLEERHQTTLRTEWHIPLPAAVPPPTYMPAMLAAGVVAMAFGVVTTMYITGIGLLVCVLAVVGWIRAMQ